MLSFQRQILQDISAEPEEYGNPDDCDGLIILAHGLGLLKLLSLVVQTHSTKEHLVLLINTPSHHLAVLRDQVVQQTRQPGLFHIIDSNINSKDRARLYKSGGVLAVTSRILVVDMLNEVVPIRLVSGILACYLSYIQVNHAHRILNASVEMFILRLFRSQVNFCLFLQTEQSGFH